MDFVVNTTGTVDVDNSLVKELAQQTLIKMHESQTIEDFVSHAQATGNASQKGVVKYNTLTIDEEPLAEKEDADSEKIVDSLVTFNPKEYGKVVTRTNLASIQTGGRVDLAAGQLLGINMGQTQTRVGMKAMDQSTNGLIGGGKANIGALTDADILTGAMANKVYSRLARMNAVGLTAANGEMVAVAHEDVLNSIRNEAGFIDVMKYASPETILKNEIGTYKGFRWVKNNLTTIAPSLGDPEEEGNIDVYNTYFIAFNALGKDTQLNPQGRITGPFDKLARFVNLGWYGIFEYKIVEQDALWIARTAGVKE